MNYNVNWTYGGDGSKKGGGYAALHGCQGDTVTFNFAGGPHNVVELDYSVAKSERTAWLCVSRCPCNAKSVRKASASSNCFSGACCAVGRTHLLGG